MPLSSSAMTTAYSWGTLNVVRIAKASFAPTPLTATSLSNIVRSSLLANPKSVHESSRTTMRVYKRTSPPTCGSPAAVVPDMPSSKPTPLTSMTAMLGVASATVP